jgi:succinyl-CoA synthetase alpha subunit
MGAEELKKRRRSHDKYIDRQRVALATLDLFTRMPEDQARSFIAVMERGIKPVVGSDYILQADKGKLMGCIGNSVHFSSASAPPDILQAMIGGAGIAVGEIIRVNSISNTVEVKTK